MTTGDAGHAADRPVVLITGSSQGIGNHLARHFLEREFTVVGCSRGAYSELDSQGYTHHVADVGSERDVVEMFRAIRATHGRLDVAINNAACNETLSLLALTSAQNAAKTLSTNVMGSFVVCREAVRLMMRRRFGRIVNFGSIVTRHEVRGDSIYTASKAAVEAMTRVLAKEVAPHGITCNVVSPTAIDTRLLAALDEDRMNELLARTAIPEVGKPEDIATTIDWLVSPAGASITGQSIHLGGA